MSEKNIKLVIAEKLSVAQYIIKIIDADTREDEYMEGKYFLLFVQQYVDIYTCDIIF